MLLISIGMLGWMTWAGPCHRSKNTAQTNWTYVGYKAQCHLQLGLLFSFYTDHAVLYRLRTVSVYCALRILSHLSFDNLCIHHPEEAIRKNHRFQLPMLGNHTTMLGSRSFARHIIVRLQR
ncbi:hypothetical protein EV426DRAFT_206823 [Tirmania nivea]|nr:hypothetical protein EV426DRAFT_206823 [Tirmania nivea]